ncbi:MAG: hypothetical protein J0L92_30725 [Deltaproteobacteria bacterium]|nr:hypothetical protein [Deltaproteobacteria bacterium]
MELEIVAPYTPDGPYLWRDLSIPTSLPSCMGVDGLDVGVYRFRLNDRRQAGLECFSYGVVPAEPLGSIDFTGDVRTTAGTVISSSAPHCDGWWQLWGLREWTLQDHNPFGEEATEGQLPPIRLQRSISGTCMPSCFDEWVAVIRHVPQADAGTLEDASR